jgi:hypothetical protein
MITKSDVTMRRKDDGGAGDISLEAYCSEEYENALSFG